jgi:uncharacterized protein (TIRG00374 family)
MTAAPRRRLPWSYIVLGLMLAVLAAATVLEWNKAQPALRQANWRLVLPAILFTFVSLAFSSASYFLINRTFRLAVPTSRLLMVGFVNMSVNNLITLGGAAGSSVSVVLLRRKDVVIRDLLAASLFNSYLHLIIGAAVLPPSILYLMLEHHLAALTRVGGAIALLVTTVVAVIAILIIFLRPVRTKIIRILCRTISLVIRRDLTKTFDDFDEALTEGLALLTARPKRVVLLLTSHLACWAFSAVALWFCFAALGKPPAPGNLFSGYFVALAAGAISMIPGGLGIQDGSMAGIYALLGTPLEIAVLASVLFRIVYYILPFLAGLAVYYREMRVAQSN